MSGIGQYEEVVTQGPRKLADMLQAMRQFLGQNDMMAYLTMMAPRMVELHRVLKPTGSIYLHCDPTASHYLKLLMDAVFGNGNFRSEIVWKRTSAHSSANRPGPVHDIIFNVCEIRRAFVESCITSRMKKNDVNTFFEMTDSDGRKWKRIPDLTGAGTRRGATGMAMEGNRHHRKGTTLGVSSFHVR